MKPAISRNFNSPCRASLRRKIGYNDWQMERIVHKSHRFKEADEWDIKQQISMTPAERMKAADDIKLRIYPKPCPDVRQCREVKAKK